MTSAGSIANREAESQTPALELRGLRKSFTNDLLKENQLVVDDLSCAFYPGRCTGLLGHNGAGKTTTIRLILGLIAPDRGGVHLFGEPISVGAKARIGYMPEINKLPVTLTAEELLRYQLRVFSPPTIKSTADLRQAITDKLDQVNLTKARNKKVRHLSKGMGRRLAWALATIHGPDVLILDEPFSGLDPLGRHDMNAWIDQEREAGTTIILCTHELRQVHSLCDDFHVLNTGRLVLTTHKDSGSDGTLVAGRDQFETRMAYNIHVSGAEESMLRDAGQTADLLPWQAWQQKGSLAVIGFDDYELAARWLRLLLERGMVVVRFGDQTFVDEDELMPFFTTPT